jgi:hypothetical protein
MKDIESQAIEYAEALNDIADVLDMPTGATSADIVKKARNLWANGIHTENETSKIRSFPEKCPACGKPKAEGWVKGWRGWECGSYSQAHDHHRENGLNFRQSIPCATDHWQQRALRAEYILTLIPIPPPNAAQSRDDGENLTT